MNAPIPPELHSEIYSDPQRTERILAIIDAIGEGWIPTIVSVFTHVQLAPYYGFPGAAITSMDGTLPFITRQEAIISLQREVKLAYQWIMYAEISGFNDVQAKAIINQRKMRVNSKISEAFNKVAENFIEGEAAPQAMFDLFDLWERSVIQVRGLDAAPQPPGTVHKHLHAHVNPAITQVNENRINDVDWNAGISDFGAVLTPQKQLIRQLPENIENEEEN